MWDVLTTGNDFAYIIVFFSTVVCITVFDRSPVAHALICRACVPVGHIPDGFWVVWEGSPYRPHSLDDGSKCHRGKELKTVCLRLARTGVISSKARIKKWTFIVMLHNQTAMSVSMLTKGKRYWQEQCRAQYCCEILWSFEQGDSSEISFIQERR